MKEFDFYNKEIMEIIRKGERVSLDKKTNKPTICYFKQCHNCAWFDDELNCKEAMLNWFESEHEEPKKITIPKDTPIDTKILVSHDGREWDRRHFAGFDGNFVVAWCDGRTSWSTNSGTYRWAYGKLAEEEE